MPINLLQYPLACVVGKPLPKAAFARHLEVSSALRRRMQEDVVSFSWLYKIAPTTLQVQASATMPEIEIFLATLKSPDCPLDVFRFIDGALPQYIVFVLQYEERYRLLVNYKQWADADCAQFRVVQSFVSEWCSAAELSLPIEGNELPVIYEHFVRRIAGNALRPISSPTTAQHPVPSPPTLLDDVLAFQRKQSLQKRLSQLEQRMYREQQPNRKFALHCRIIQLQNELNSL